MPTITIQGTIIDFPNSGASPNWAPAVIEFAQAVEEAIASAIGEFDVPPQVLTIDSSNPASNVDITALNFPTSDVRGVDIFYSVFRETDSTSAVESGTMTIVYNSDGSIGNKWELTREYTGPGAEIEFNITDTGQVQYTTTALSGINHIGRISFYARSLPQE